MLDIQSVGIKKSKGEPALLIKPSLLICACFETVIEQHAHNQTFRFLISPDFAASVERSVTADRKRAGSWDEITFNEFLVGDVAGTT